MVATTPAALPGISSASCFKAEAEAAAAGGACGKGARAKAKASANAKNKEPNGKKARVEATRQRTKTMREYEGVKMALIRAKAAGEDVLDKVAYEVHATQEQVDEDVTLNIIRDRLAIVNAAMASSRGSLEGNQAADLHLYQLCMSDPYLKDFQATLLAAEAGVQTYGSITYTRETTLELQPTVEKVWTISAALWRFSRKSPLAWLQRQHAGRTVLPL